MKKKKKKPKIPRPASEAKVERLKNGIRERASSWGGKPTKNRSKIKNELKNYGDGNSPSFSFMA